MPLTRLDTLFLQRFQHLMKSGLLQTGESLAVRRLLVTNAQVGKNAGDLHMGQLVQRRDLINRGCRLPQPVHTRIHLHLPAQMIAGGFHLLAVSRIHHGLCQAVSFQQAELLRRCISQHQDFSPDTVFSKLYPFLGGSHTKGFDALFSKKPGRHFGSHAVAVRFDGRHQRTICRKQFLQFPHIMAKRLFVHLHPGPAL